MLRELSQEQRERNEEFSNEIRARDSVRYTENKGYYNSRTEQKSKEKRGKNKES